MGIYSLCELVTSMGLKNVTEDGLAVLREADVKFSELLLGMIIQVLNQVMDSVPEKEKKKAPCSWHGSKRSVHGEEATAAGLKRKHQDNRKLERANADSALSCFRSNKTSRHLISEPNSALH